MQLEKSASHPACKQGACVVDGVRWTTDYQPEMVWRKKKTYFNEFSRSDDKRKHRAIAGDEEKTAGRNGGRRIINYI